MIETTYTCDRCNNTQNTPHQFWTLGYDYRHTGKSLFTPAEGNSIQVCRGCLEGFGLLPVPVCQGETPPRVDTEDLIREIIERCAND